MGILLNIAKWWNRDRLKASAKETVARVNAKIEAEKVEKTAQEFEEKKESVKKEAFERSSVAILAAWVKGEEVTVKWPVYSLSYDGKRIYEEREYGEAKMEKHTFTPTQKDVDLAFENLKANSKDLTADFVEYMTSCSPTDNFFVKGDKLYKDTYLINKFIEAGIDPQAEVPDRNSRYGEKMTVFEWTARNVRNRSNGPSLLMDSPKFDPEKHDPDLVYSNLVYEATCVTPQAGDWFRDAQKIKEDIDASIKKAMTKGVGLIGKDGGYARIDDGCYVNVRGLLPDCKLTGKEVNSYLNEIYDQVKDTPEVQKHLDRQEHREKVVAPILAEKGKDSERRRATELLVGLRKSGEKDLAQAIRKERQAEKAGQEKPVTAPAIPAKKSASIDATMLAMKGNQGH